jgi:hypothetical protein
MQKQHRETVQLRAVVIAGPFWRRHRQCLISDRRITWRGPYHIRDVTTGETHAWRIWPDRVTIGVSTLWAYTHPGWTKHRYELVPAPIPGRKPALPWWRVPWLQALHRRVRQCG